MVTLRFTDVPHREAFLQDIAPLAKYCREHEPGTVAYEVLLSDKDELMVLIMERYRDKENAFLKEHRSSAPFQAFRPKLQAMQENGHVQISGESFTDSGIGFGDRAA